MLVVLFFILVVLSFGWIPALLIIGVYAFLDCDLTLYICSLLNKSPSFAQKCVWITGASSGIGEELAYQMAKQGATLILSARRESELERVKKNCQNSSKHIIIPLDLDNNATHPDIVKKVFDKVKKVDILINNAGRSQRSLAEDTVLSVDESLLHTNTIGSISLTKSILPYFIRQYQQTKESPQIVVVSSIAGKVGAPMSSGYSASKHALHGFFNALRIEQPTISICLVCPGPVVSSIGDAALTSDGATVKEKKVAPVYNQKARMKTDRCASLILAGTFWRLNEIWMSPNPELIFGYIGQYSPVLFALLASVIGHQSVKKWKEAQKSN